MALNKKDRTIAVLRKQDSLTHLVQILEQLAVTDNVRSLVLVKGAVVVADKEGEVARCSSHTETRRSEEQAPVQLSFLLPPSRAVDD